MKFNKNKKEKSKKPIQKTRKELRKDKRKQKKTNRASYHGQKKQKPGELKHENDKAKVVEKPVPVVLKPKKQVDRVLKRLQQEKKREKKLAKEMERSRKKQLIKANEKEDRIIKDLEKRLHLNKRKSKTTPKSFADDGLDYLLDFCNDENRKVAVETEKRLLGGEVDSDFEEDFAMATRTGKDNKESDDEDFDNDEFGPDDNSSDQDDELDDALSNEEEDLDEMPSDDEESAMETDESLDEEIKPPKLKIQKKNSTSKVIQSSKKLSKVMKHESDDSIHSSDMDDDNDDEVESSNHKSQRKNFTSKTSQSSKKSPKIIENKSDDSTHSSDMDDDDDDEEIESSNLKPHNKNSTSKAVQSSKKLPKVIKHESDDSIDSSDMDDDDDFSDKEKSEHEDSSNKKPVTNSDGTWEDIYGRKRDKDGNVVTTESNKYIPPGARLKQFEKDSESSEKLMRLRKQLKGYLNRLAEQNMHTIAGQVEDLYMSNSRNDMNEVIAKLMMESIVAPVITPDRLIAEHMMLVAVLHANVGTEVGAHFLLTVVKKLDEMMKTPQEVENKEMDNIILIISHLYNFKVFGSQLLYQILGKLSDRFTEKEIECILLILKTVGFLLRKDDPVALKELILRLQQKATESKSENTRIKFMLDVLLAIKNNNMSKIPQYDPSHVEHLKKIMKTFLRKGNTVSQFNISLEDLLQVNERGKWWVVGSAWSGNNDLTKAKKSDKADGKPLFSEKILELARKQRMNTDTRRNIFCILMTAEDYMDAFEKLQHLGLKDQQAREILYVIMDCCLQEKKFNPYYAVLAQKFCDYDRKNQMTLQYSIWDKLKELDNYSHTQLTNFSKFLTHLFLEKGLPLSALKVIEFGQLDKPTMRLVRQIVLGILLHEDVEACAHVFERISVSPKLKSFREGLRLFINHFLVKHAETRAIAKNDIGMLKTRADLADKILLTQAGHIIF